MSTPEQPTAAEAPPRKRQPLYIRMYYEAIYVELVRFIGYGGKPLANAQEFVLALEKKYGRERVIEASEAVSTCEGKAENMTVRLTAEARRLAWQLLGPPPEHKATDMMAEIIASGERRKPAARPTDKPKKPQEPRAKPAVEAPATPVLQQYREAKERHPGMLLLFRMGDFYELFEEDAECAVKLLGLTLTTRDRTMSMAGFPHHCLESYLRKLLQAGHRVAICEQVSEALPSEPIHREVTRVVIPGTTGEETVQEHEVPADADQSAHPDVRSTPAPPRPPARLGSRKQSIARKRQGPTGG
jgi:hypothetical protein